MPQQQEPHHEAQQIRQPIPAQGDSSTQRNDHRIQIMHVSGQHRADHTPTPAVPQADPQQRGNFRRSILKGPRFKTVGLSRLEIIDMIPHREASSARHE
jgi:hypothetical protein